MLKTFLTYLVIGAALFIGWFVIGPALLRLLHLLGL